MSFLKDFSVLEEFDLSQLCKPELSLMINASIVSYQDKYLLAYRKNNLDYFDVKNFLMTINSEGDLICEVPLFAENGNSAFEDFRLFFYQDKLMALYTYLPQKNNKEWVWENGISICEVDIETGILIKQQSLRFLSKNIDEKNWIPLISNNQLYIVTSLEPTLRVLIVEGDIGNFKVTDFYQSQKISPFWNLGEIRGGTPYFNLPKSKSELWHYSFVHSSVYLPNGSHLSRYYYYTLMRINLLRLESEIIATPIGFSIDELNIIDTPYSLKRKDGAIKVVFPIGIASYKEGILMSFGKDDCISKVKYFDWKSIENEFLKNETKILKYRAI